MCTQACTLGATLKLLQIHQLRRGSMFLSKVALGLNVICHISSPAVQCATVNGQTRRSHLTQPSRRVTLAMDLHSSFAKSTRIRCFQSQLVAFLTSLDNVTTTRLPNTQHMWLAWPRNVASSYRSKHGLKLAGITLRQKVAAPSILQVDSGMLTCSLLLLCERVALAYVCMPAETSCLRHAYT